MTKKPFHSMSEDFDELEIEPVRMREPDIPDDWLEAETGEASKPRDKSAGEIHMSWLNENSHSKPERAIERSAFRELKAENERQDAALVDMSLDYGKLRAEAEKLAAALEPAQEWAADDEPMKTLLENARKALTNWQRYLKQNTKET